MHYLFYSNAVTVYFYFFFFFIKTFCSVKWILRYLYWVIVLRYLFDNYIVHIIILSTY